MAKVGIYAGDLKIGYIVRVPSEMWRVARVDQYDPDEVHAETWRVSRVDHYGSDEVEIVFVKPDESGQLIVNMHPGRILERLA